MIKIAICDDQTEYLKMIAYQLAEIEDKLCAEFSCDSYQDGQEIVKACEKFEPDHYQIIIFDIQMREISGIDAARYLRDNGWSRTKFIFVSSYNTYFQQLCSVETFAFVNKEKLEEEFEPHFLRAYNHVCRDKGSMFLYNKNKVSKAIPMQEIAYFENKGHNVIIHKMDGEAICIYNTLPKIMAELPETKFILPQKSFFVNIDFIDKISNDKIYLKDGTVKVMGRQYKQEAMQKYLAIVKGGRPL